ncbi:MAG: nucleotidyltransferase family protein [Candidatus Omnitrophota bacterium]|nr:MAG: nucleotidyltransferase family protein [Candidatus Omnitrophota bacterium]
MKALILAAGYAKRLYPLTKDFPKPLLRVAKKPIINYITEELERISTVSEIIVITNSKFLPHFKKWKKHFHFSKPVTLIDDLTRSNSTRRGAIGDMAFAIKKKKICHDLLVIGGDNIFDVSLNDFLSFARRKKPHPTIGIYKLKNIKQARNYGVVRIDRKKRLIGFQEKPANPWSSLVAMCLYFFPKEKLRLIGEYAAIKHDKHDATGFYISWLMKKETVYGFIFKKNWYDIGHHDTYEQARRIFLKNKN